MKLVRQINDMSCVHACISMVTGVSVEELWARFSAPLCSQEEYLLLIEQGVFPEDRQTHPLSDYPFPVEGLYFVTVPSLNFAGKNHCVVVEASREEYVCYDPQCGRPGKKWYTADCFNTKSQTPVLGYTNIVRMNFDLLKSATFRSAAQEVVSELVGANKVDSLFYYRLLDQIVQPTLSINSTYSRHNVIANRGLLLGCAALSLLSWCERLTRYHGPIEDKPIATVVSEFDGTESTAEFNLEGAEALGQLEVGARLYTDWQLYRHAEHLQHYANRLEEELSAKDEKLFSLEQKLSKALRGVEAGYQPGVGRVEEKAAE